MCEIDEFEYVEALCSLEKELHKKGTYTLSEYFNLFEVAENIYHCCKSDCKKYASLCMEKIFEELETDKTNADLYLKLAILYKFYKNIPMALENINKAIDIDPNNYALYQERGFIYQDINDIDKAIIDFKKAVSLNRLMTISSSLYLLAYEKKAEISTVVGRENEVDLI